MFRWWYSSLLWKGKGIFDQQQTTIITKRKTTDGWEDRRQSNSCRMYIPNDCWAVEDLQFQFYVIVILFYCLQKRTYNKVWRNNENCNANDLHKWKQLYCRRSTCIRPNQHLPEPELYSAIAACDLYTRNRKIGRLAEICQFSSCTSFNSTDAKQTFVIKTRSRACHWLLLSRPRVNLPILIMYVIQLHRCETDV